MEDFVYEILGIKESKGTYENTEYHNYHLQLSQPINNERGYGQQVKSAKIKPVMLDSMIEEVGGLVQDLIGRQVTVVEDKYDKVRFLQLV